MQRGVYAGSFDPVTHGHLWMIEQGAALFDELIVAIGQNPNKQCTFEVEERLAMLRDVSSHLPNVTVAVFDHQFLVNYASCVDAQYILRGIRSASDYEFERTMRYINGDLQPEIHTLFLMPPREIAEVSSTMVKGLAGPQGWQEVVRQYLPEPVYQRFLIKFNQG